MLKLTHEYKRVVALISDLHVGSRFALWPEDYTSPFDKSNISAMMNPGQKRILSYWKDFVKTCIDFKVDSIFLVGDATAGYNPKEHGMYMMTTDIEEQVEATVRLLEPLCKGRKLAVWRGTPYHESLATNIKIHKAIAERLDGTYFDAVANLKLTPSKRVANVAHKSTGAVMYPETAMGRDMLTLKEAEALGYLPTKIDVIIRAHRHKWCHIHKRGVHFIQLPCWQAFIPWYGAVRWYTRMQPDLGGAIMLIDSKDRIRVFHFLYPAVHIADRTLKF